MSPQREAAAGFSFSGLHAATGRLETIVVTGIVCRI
jgi:hypothetical protein